MIQVVMCQNQCTHLGGSSALPSLAVVVAVVLEER